MAAPKRTAAKKPAPSDPAEFTKPEKRPESIDEGWTPFQAPRFSCGSLVVQSTGNDFILMLMQPSPMQTPEGAQTGAVKNEVIAIVTMSPQTAKDFAILLTSRVKKYETEYQVDLQTPFTRRLADGIKNAKKGH